MQGELAALFHSLADDMGDAAGSMAGAISRFTETTADIEDANVARTLAAEADTVRACHVLARRGFLFGGFSIADCMYGPVVSRFLTYGVALSPRLQAYADKMMALPAMRDWGTASKAEIEAGLA